MKKFFCSFVSIIMLALILICVPQFNAQGEDNAILTINNNDSFSPPQIEDDVRLKIGGVYEFVKEKLDTGLDGENILNYLSPNLGTAYYHTLRLKEIKPIDATVKIDKDGHCLELIAGKNGKIFDKKEACLAIAKVLDGTSSHINYQEAPPVVTLEKLKNQTELMASFSTDLGYSSEERVYNIQLASSFINGIVIPSGSDFSFNDTVGARTTARGFKESTVITDGEYTLGVGGGVCQLSTTLYNAVLLSGLKTKRVARHSYPAKYVEPSRDAMVSEYSDFIFTNSTDHNIYVFAFVENNRLSVKIYGEIQGCFTLKSVVTARTPFINTDEEGNILYSTIGYTQVSRGIEGTTSELYIIDQNGKERMLRSDTYKAKNAIYKKI